MEDKPIWEIINTTMKELGGISNEIPKLYTSANIQSEQIFNFTFSPDIDKQHPEDCRKRVDFIINLKNKLSENLKNFETSFHGLQENIELIACDPTLHSNLQDSAKNLLRLFQQRQKQGGRDPFVPHQDLIERGKSVLNVLDILIFSHSHTLQDLYLILNHHQSAALTSLDLAFNWPLILTSLTGLENLRKSLKKELRISSLNPKQRLSVCWSTEIEYVLQKLTRCAALVFNSAKNDKASSPAPQSSGVFNQILATFFDFSIPFEVQYMTPQQILRESFREIMTKFYKVADITGDGNCFFRAVIRFVFPSIPRDYEDSLSLQLREMVNLNTDINERFQDFVEESENDAQTMLQSGSARLLFP
eukprot:TRINITY_DN2596_c0_g1_i1.p1 TRINITY_DN2596_c0_g1~~TRINITY_DN2596_c0_g1_i1.p1  ORF type:complete len:373 (+),score=56.44 TRINITY_DN2596_c0_g1_i1:36-1121(+)